jgi:membrane associated rhomboid family serine protease
MAVGLVKDAVRHGQLWRLLTAGALHVNPWHLIGNVAALSALGRMVEVLAHWSRLAIVFLLSILSGSLFSLLLLPEATSVGASGGLMGLLGFLLVLGTRVSNGVPPRFVRSLMGGVLWVAATGIIAYAFIDNAAHLGGLLAGVGLGLVLVPRHARMPLPADPVTAGAGAASMVVLILVVLGSVAVLLRCA